MERKEEKNSFEQRLQRLSEIVSKIEQSTLPLEEALALFKEGTVLSNELTKELEEASAQIEELVGKGEN